MTTEEKIKKIWSKLSNDFDIKLTQQGHDEIMEILCDEFENFAEDKINELGKIMKQLSIPGSRSL